MLAWPGVTGAIVGAKNPQQPSGWLTAGSLTLEPQDLDRIARAIETSGPVPVSLTFPASSAIQSQTGRKQIVDRAGCSSREA